MNYEEALQFIHGTRWLGSKLGLRRVGLLLERMGNPQDKLRFIHVAGTNGKGSTSSMISRALCEAGLKTGLFISPYVLDFRERIQLNHEMIPKAQLILSVEAVKPHWEALSALDETPTEFEVVTAAAMDYFMRMNCDAVVLEVGLGGRVDSTNIIKTPLCSVLTSIGLEHQEYLGDTLAAIASEKCGIIKPGGVTVCCPGQVPEVMEVVSEACKARDNALIVPRAPKVLKSGLNGSEIEYDGMALHIPLVGAYQLANAVTAVEAVKAAAKSGLAVTREHIAGGIAKTVFPARFEVLSHKPLVILDGAHNPPGAEKLAESLKLLSGRKIHGVFCAMGDKDVEGILKLVLPLCETVTCVKTDIPRAMEAHDMLRLAGKYCKKASLAETLDSALTRPLADAGDDGAVLIFGSLYFAAEIRPVAQKLLLNLG